MMVVITNRAHHENTGVSDHSVAGDGCC